MPTLVVSPYARKGYVDDAEADLCAPLKFIEDNWGLPYLTARIEGSHNFEHVFDFSEPTDGRPPGAGDRDLLRLAVGVPRRRLPRLARGHRAGREPLRAAGPVEGPASRVGRRRQPEDRFQDRRLRPLGHPPGGESSGASPRLGSRLPRMGAEEIEEGACTLDPRLDHRRALPATRRVYIGGHVRAALRKRGRATDLPEPAVRARVLGLPRETPSWSTLAGRKPAAPR